jgi:selenocysteine lyase/cysteine desulfurase
VHGLDDLGYVLVSPRSGPARTSLVLFNHADAQRNGAIASGLAAQRIHVAEREGKLRIAPHLYNEPADIDRTLEVLADLR